MLAGLILSLWAATTSVIEVHGEVDETMSHEIRRSIAAASRAHAQTIVFDVDSWGGELMAAFDISDAITSAPVPTMAFVRRKAISAGALIALSSREVYMAPGATIGDCAPIISTSEGPKFVGEKVESPLRARFRALARRSGLEPLLAEKMVSRDWEVVAALDPKLGRSTYYRIQDFAALPDSVKAHYQVRIVVPEGQLLTLDNAEALTYGFSRGTYKDLGALLNAKRLQSPQKHLSLNWSEKLARMLSGWAPLLFTIGIALLWIEYKTPGGFLFGMAGFLVLGIALGAKYVMGLADYTPLLLAAFGILLFFFEVWLLPGTVIPSVIGGLCLLAALTMSLQGFVWPHTGNHAEVALSLQSLATIGICLVAGFGLSLLAVRYFLPHLPGHDGMRLDAALPSLAPADAPNLAGKFGITLTDLRPRGTIEVDGQELEGSSQEGYLPAGTHVRLIAPADLGWSVERIRT